MNDSRDDEMLDMTSDAVEAVVVLPAGASSSRERQVLPMD
jgi:hypothetical protein